MPTYVVGPGLAQAMTQDETTPASDELYVNGNRAEAQWSEAMALNGAVYRWVRATNRVHRFSPGGRQSSLATKLRRVIQIGQSKGWKPYSGPVIGQPDAWRWGDPGYDCSSFVSSMYREAFGIALPGFTDAIADRTDQIPQHQALPGDIMLYRYVDLSQHGVVFPHTGLWLGNGQMLDCQFPAGLGTHPLLARPYQLHRARGL